MTLRLHSPVGYEFVRNSFDNALPHSSTIRSWYSSIDAKPGHMREAYDHLKRMAEEKHYPVCICMDEMSIRQQIQYIPSEDRHTGFVTYGLCEENGDMKHATKALVFMVQGLNEPFKIAVSYFFISSLLAAQRAQLLMEVVEMVISTGMSVRCITADGDGNNFAAYNWLGADFQSLEPFIISSKAPNQRIHITMDAPHMLKNARNLLGRYETIWNSKGEPVEWNYFEKLVNYQKNSTHKIGGVKINKKHIEFDKCKMSVHIAAETLSSSVTKAFRYLKASQPNEFSNVEATAEYTEYINDAFDILNSHNDEASGFKAPMTPANIENIKQFATKFSAYLQDFTAIYRGKVVNIMKSPLKTAFIGLVCTLNNSINLYTELVETGMCDKLRTLYETQDTLENYFGRIRQLGGFNRNPNTVEFEGAMRKLLFDNEVKASEYSNVRPHSIPLLTISSYKKKPQTTLQEERQSVALMEEELSEQLQEIDQSNQPSHENNGRSLDEMIAYRAACLEKTILFKVKSCDQCKSKWFEGEKVNDLYVEMVKNGEKLNQPCIDTVEIVKYAESYVNHRVENAEHFEAISNTILGHFNIENVYTSLNHECNYKKDFIKILVNFYLRVRFMEVAANQTESLMKVFWGNNAAKQKQFAGQ